SGHCQRDHRGRAVLASLGRHRVNWALALIKRRKRKDLKGTKRVSTPLVKADPRLSFEQGRHPEKNLVRLDLAAEERHPIGRTMPGTIAPYAVDESRPPCTLRREEALRRNGREEDSRQVNPVRTKSQAAKLCVDGRDTRAA